MHIRAIACKGSQELHISSMACSTGHACSRDQQLRLLLPPGSPSAALRGSSCTLD